MASRKQHETEDRPIHVSRADELDGSQGGTASHSRDGSVHARDGSEQPRLDDMAHHAHSGSAAPSPGQPEGDRDVGQFTGEGQPSRQKK